MYHVLEFNQSQWVETYVEFNTQKTIEADKNGDKYGKALYNEQCFIRQNNGKLRKRINVKLVSSKKDYLTKPHVTKNI